MLELKGIPVSPGFAEGTAVLRRSVETLDIPRRTIDASEVTNELQRFHDAVTEACRELEQVRLRVLTELGPAESALFAAHVSMLGDKHLAEKVTVRVSRELVNVEYAVQVEMDELAAMLSSVKNDYLRQRTQDIRDVGRRLLRHLLRSGTGTFSQLLGRSVVVTGELLPSETLDLDRHHLAAIVTEQGGENSHFAILARSLGVPAVTGVPDVTSLIEQSAPLLVDGKAGRVVVTPTESRRRDFNAAKTRYEAGIAAALDTKSRDCVTRDGCRISLMANINRPWEAHLIERHGLDGVGLFRTEFFFLRSPTPPSYEEQRNAYQKAAVAMGNRPLIIRTLDLGGDKLPVFLDRQHPANPNLGLRGLRFSLAEEDLFEVQLRAIVSLADSHEVGILFPMVLGGDDFRQGIAAVEVAMARTGVKTRPPIGAMIETPAALFALEEILEVADFASIGTNDLTQFMLAADRGSAEQAQVYSVLHPSVLRAIQRVVTACRKAGRDVCVCGEVAGDPQIAPLLVGLGVRQLSMSPIRAATIRSVLRERNLPQLEQLASDALRCSSVSNVKELLLKPTVAMQTERATQVGPPGSVQKLIT